MNPATVALPDTAAELERAEEYMLQKVQAITFLKHHFAPGIYVREIWMPAGAVILGHEHLTEHLNIVVCGKCLVRAEGEVRVISAGPVPFTFKSGAGVRKALYIIEDTTWMTVHENLNDQRDIPTLEGRIVRKSAIFSAHERLQRSAEMRDLARARYNLPN